MPRTFAIPDIHGCCRTFRLLLEQIKLQKDDTLYLLGDYIDRGPDSKGVITEIIARREDGYDVRPVLGNHEDMLLKYLDSHDDEDRFTWLDNGGDITLKSYGVQYPGDIDHDHLEFMRALPLYHKTDTHVFVHAGLNFCLKNPLSPIGRESMLWQRSEAADRRKIGGRRVVSGHTIQQLEDIERSIFSSHIRLDNGCFTAGRYQGMGSLVALNLHENELYVQDFVG